MEEINKKSKAYNIFVKKNIIENDHNCKETTLTRSILAKDQTNWFQAHKPKPNQAWSLFNDPTIYKQVILVSQSVHVSQN